MHFGFRMNCVFTDHQCSSSTRGPFEASGPRDSTFSFSCKLKRKSCTTFCSCLIPENNYCKLLLMHDIFSFLKLYHNSVKAWLIQPFGNIYSVAKIALQFYVKFWSRVDSWVCHLTIGPASHIKQYTHPTNTTTHYLLHQLTQIFPIGAIHIADCIVWSSYYTCDTLVEGLLTGNLKSSGKIALISSVCHLKNIAHFIFY